MSRPLSDRVLVRCERTPETVNGIIIPDTQRKKLNRGRIEAVGPKVLSDSIVPGRNVIFQAGAGISIDDELQLIREAEINMVVQ